MLGWGEWGWQGSGLGEKVWWRVHLGVAGCGGEKGISGAWSVK